MDVFYNVITILRKTGLEKFSDLLKATLEAIQSQTCPVSEPRFPVYSYQPKDPNFKIFCFTLLSTIVSAYSMLLTWS